MLSQRLCLSRAAGADHVSVMVAARWVVPTWGNNQAFLRERLTRDYDVAICPWTGDGCP